MGMHGLPRKASWCHRARYVFMNVMSCRATNLDGMSLWPFIGIHQCRPNTFACLFGSVKRKHRSNDQWRSGFRSQFRSSSNFDSHLLPQLLASGTLHSPYETTRTHVDSWPRIRGRTAASTSERGRVSRKVMHTISIARPILQHPSRLYWRTHAWRASMEPRSSIWLQEPES